MVLLFFLFFLTRNAFCVSYYIISLIIFEQIDLLFSFNIPVKKFKYYWFSLKGFKNITRVIM